MTEFRKLLQNPVLAEAIVALKDECPIMDVAAGADPVASVRKLSQICQHNFVIDLFLSMAQPLPPKPNMDEVASFGVDLTQFNKPPVP